MVLGKLPVPGRPTIWTTVGQGLDIFTLTYPFSPLSPSLWETARYRLKYCLKGPLNPKQPINNPIHSLNINNKQVLASQFISIRSKGRVRTCTLTYFRNKYEPLRYGKRLTSCQID